MCEKYVDSAFASSPENSMPVSDTNDGGMLREILIDDFREVSWDYMDCCASYIFQ